MVDAFRFSLSRSLFSPPFHPSQSFSISSPSSPFNTVDLSGWTLVDGDPEHEPIVLPDDERARQNWLHGNWDMARGALECASVPLTEASSTSQE